MVLLLARTSWCRKWTENCAHAIQATAREVRSLHYAIRNVLCSCTAGSPRSAIFADSANAQYPRELRKEHELVVWSSRRQYTCGQETGEWQFPVRSDFTPCLSDTATRACFLYYKIYRCESTHAHGFMKQHESRSKACLGCDLVSVIRCFGRA